jgi:hypothetical protein
MLVDELKVKDDNTGYTFPHMPLSMNPQFGDNMIVHGSISTKKMLHDKGKNTRLSIQLPKTRFYFLYTLVIPFGRGIMKVALKCWRKIQQTQSNCPQQKMKSLCITNKQM